MQDIIYRFAETEEGGVFFAELVPAPFINGGSLFYQKKGKYLMTKKKKVV